MPSLANYNVSKKKEAFTMSTNQCLLKSNLLFKDLLPINKAASIKAKKQE